MIQRIQTLYLLLAVAALVVAMCLPMAFMVEPSGKVELMNNLGVTMSSEYQTTWGLFAILMIAAIASTGAIFLFKNRMKQLRFTIFSSIMCIGYYLAFFAFYLILKDDAIEFRINWPLCLALVALIFNYLAIRAIGRDEAMVQASDRLDRKSVV